MHFRISCLFLFLLFFLAPNPSQTFAFQGTPVFQATPNPLDFGPGLVGVPLSSAPGLCCAFGTVIVTNPGTATLLINGLSITGDFIDGQNPSFPPFPLTMVAPGDQGGVEMTFQPNTAGPATGMLVFQDNAAGSPHTVQLMGTGVAPGDFGIGTGTGAKSLTVTAGQTADFFLILAAGSGFSGTVSFTCSGLPVGTTCGAVPTLVTGPTIIPGRGVLVTTTGSGMTSLKFLPLGSSFAVAAISCLARKRRGLSITALMLALFLTGTLVSCGGGGGGNGSGPPTPAGTYSFTVTGTSGSLSHSTQLTLVVK